jgi:hypothetical protein
VSADPNDGYGATYHRGLLELIGRRMRLGSMTWTSYPTSDGRMQFELMVTTMPGTDGAGDAVWKGENPGALDASTILKQKDGSDARSQELSPAGTEVVGYLDGLAFGSELAYDGIGSDSVPYDILVLGVQLGNLYQVAGPEAGDLVGKQEFGLKTSSDDFDVLPSTVKGLPTPITESPLFEDVTFNFLRPTPEILYAEEGVSE